jgi:tripartite-type tricarboxylate transporter receptor subunit TctC
LPALRTTHPYNVERDLAPVSMVMVTSFALAVHTSVPVRDVKGLIALARSQPGKLTFSTPGVGSSSHFAGEVFKMMANVKMLHVPYRGAPEAAGGGG